MALPPHNNFTPEQVAAELGYPLDKVRGMQHGPYALHSHLTFYQLTLNGPDGVTIVPYRVHNSVTGETHTRMQNDAGAYTLDHATTQKIFDDAHAQMRLVQHKLIPAIGKAFPEHDPENTMHEIKQTPSGPRIAPVGDWASNRALVPVPDFKVDHDWVLHVDVSRIAQEHHGKIHEAIGPHLPEHHKFIA